MAVSFDEVIKLAEQLTPAQQNVLIYRLRVRQIHQRASFEPSTPTRYIHHQLLQPGSELANSREHLISEAESLRKTPPHSEDRLLGKYANPNLTDISEEDFHAQLHAIATEWEQELDEFTNDET